MARIAAHARSADDMSRPLEIRTMAGARGAQAAEDVVMGAPRLRQARTGEVVDPVIDARYRHAIEIFLIRIERYPVLRIGKLLGEGSQPHMARRHAHEFRIQCLAGE